MLTNLPRQTDQAKAGNHRHGDDDWPRAAEWPVWGSLFADSILFRGFLQRDLSALARIVADNSTAALSFNDPKTATETLGALRARPHVAGACIYRLDATTLATYARQGTFRCPPAIQPGQHKVLERRSDCFEGHSAERPPDRHADAGLRSERTLRAHQAVRKQRRYWAVLLARRVCWRSCSHRGCAR